MNGIESYATRADRLIEEYTQYNCSKLDPRHEYLHDIAAQRLTSLFRIDSSSVPEDAIKLAKLAAAQYFEVLDYKPSHILLDPEALMQYKTKCEAALELFERLTKICGHPSSASNLIYKWSSLIIDSKILLEDDIRDALQAASTNRPTLDQRKVLLDMTSEIGVKYSFIGFPATSEKEAYECKELVKYIERQKLPIIPILMSRAVESDLEPIFNIQQECKIPVLVDLYICTSLLRYQIENWTLDDLLQKLELVAEAARAKGLQYRIAFEDSSRAAPSMLKKALNHAIALHPQSIVLNDTVGELTPSGTFQLVQFVKREIDAVDPEIALAWHGHNDKGLALANCLAAIDAGATIISGTFLGIGERAGNIPLEQLVYILSESGDTDYKLSALPLLCNYFVQMTGHTVPLNQPLIGQDVFTTSTGTHAAAVSKGKKFGSTFADLVFSGVEASLLNRKQKIILGSNTGRRGVEAFFEEHDVQYKSEDVDLLLAHCKTLTKPLKDIDQVLKIIAQQSSE